MGLLKVGTKRMGQCKFVSQRQDLYKYVSTTRCLCMCVQRESRVVETSRRVTEGVSLSLCHWAELGYLES